MPVERHLADCPSCRAELAQLQMVLQAVKTTPDVEPPPWLATRVMARVREEAVPQRNWLARLFLPLHLKLPLEAFALLMICVTAWYVTQEVERSQQVKPDLPQVMAPVGESARESAVQPAPVPPPAATVVPKAQTHPLVQPGTPVVQEPPVFAPPPQAAADRTERIERAKAASEAAPAAPAASPEQAAGSTASMAERKAATRRKAESSDNRLDTAVSQPLRLRLVAHDRDAFAGKLADLLQRLNGSLISSRPGNSVIRIEAARLPELLVQLAMLGRVTEQPVMETNRTGSVELRIFW